MAQAERHEAGAAHESVEGSGVYPASGPRPHGDALLRGQGEFAHPEERVRAQLPAGRWPGHTPLLLVGRAVFGGYFLYNAVNHFKNHGAMTAYAQSKQVPRPGFAVAATGAMLLAGGLSLITGVKPRLGTSLIATFLLGVSPKMHDFWAIEDPAQRMQELVNFSKNMGLLGGTALAAALPRPWPFSLER